MENLHWGSRSNVMGRAVVIILIFSSSITTSKNSIFLTFYLYFSSFTYKLFSANCFTISFTISLCLFSFFILIIILLMKLATSLVLIKFHRILFITIWNVTGGLVSPKNITVSSNNSSGVINVIFHSSFFFIYTLL